MLETYVKLDGAVIDLTGLPVDQAAYLAGCVDTYRAGPTSREFHRLVFGIGNPVLERRPDLNPELGYVTREAYATPLFQVLRDLLFRIEIREGSVAGDADAVSQDPFADEWVSTATAAVQLDMSVVAVHKAIDAGRLIAKPAREGGRNLVVSQNSIHAYQGDEIRRANGAQGGRPGSGT